MRKFLLATTLLAAPVLAAAQPIATPGGSAVAGPAGTTWSVNASGQVMQGKTAVPGGGDTSEVEVVNGVVWGKDNGNPNHYSPNPGGWFQLSGNATSWTPSTTPPPAVAATTAPTATALASTPVTAPALNTPSTTVTAPPLLSTPCTATTPAATSDSTTGNGSGSNFTTANGQFIGPNGQPWVGHGINVADNSMSSAQQSLLSDFPGTTFIRLNVYAYQDPSVYAAFINWATANHITVEIDDHSGFPSNAFSGSSLSAEASFFSAMAAYYKNYSNLMYESQNEPQGGNIDAEQEAVYNAVRSTGNNSPVGFNVYGGGDSGFSSYENATWLKTTTNTYITEHFYGWSSGYSTDPTAVQNALDSELTEGQFTNANGAMPIAIDEFGNSTDGSNTDANGVQVVNAVDGSGLTTAAWAWAPGGPSDLLLTGQGSGSVTAYGQQVAAAIAAAPAIDTGVTASAPASCQSPVATANAPAVTAPALTANPLSVQQVAAMAAGN